MGKEDAVIATLSKIFIERSESFLGAAKALSHPYFENHFNQESLPPELEFRDPVYFMLLHSAELSIKARLHESGENPQNWHDLFALHGKLTKGRCRADFRYLSQEIRSRRIEFIKAKWSSMKDNGYAEAAANIEIQGETKNVRSAAHVMRSLNCLGEGRGMTKYEFGIKIDKKEWKHSTRYPRSGITSYPDLLDSITLCEGLIELARGAHA
jgi:HEPN domain-containing protein